MPYRHLAPLALFAALAACDKDPAPVSSPIHAAVVPPTTAPPPAMALAHATRAAPEEQPPRERTEQEQALSDAGIPWDANRTMAVLGRIAANLNESRYSWNTHVVESQGVYDFDCSGLAGWVLRRSAPRAHAVTHAGLAGRPLARDFYRAIARAPLEPKAERGFQRIERVVDARPGDVVAWIKPAILTQSPNTGHVAFLARPPYALPGTSNAFLIRVIDSTSLYHDDDTREAGARTGFGMGTLLLVTDDRGAPAAYSWVGTRSRTFETTIAIGRPLG